MTAKKPYRNVDGYISAQRWTNRAELERRQVLFYEMEQKHLKQQIRQADITGQKNQKISLERQLRRLEEKIVTHRKRHDDFYQKAQAARERGKKG